jgi:hypothetical protein
MSPSTLLGALDRENLFADTDLGYADSKVKKDRILA